MDQEDDFRMHAQQRVNDATFLTSVAPDMQPKKHQSKIGRPGGISNTNKSNSFINRVTIEDDVAEMLPPRGSTLSVDNADDESEEMNASDIDFNDPYSDDDETIPIDEKKFWEYIFKLEENNLFEMNLLQELQQSLEIQERKSELIVREKRNEI